ncbi:MAG TPA: aminopeptidase, partial [Planctomycetaceae bacterium]|nr:aminopeptidase [Planctomycetaceae bacterium]
MNRSFYIQTLLGLIAVANCPLLTTIASATENADAATKRIGNDIEYLASDELEGRGPGTKGLQVAAEFIRDTFKEAGLKGGAEDGSYMQPFQIGLGTKPVMKKTWLILRGPDGQEMKLEAGEDYQPLATGGNGNAESEIIFIGYGISAADKKYDDYEGIDVDGKVVLMIRRE